MKNPSNCNCLHEDVVEIGTNHMFQTSSNDFCVADDITLNSQNYEIISNPCYEDHTQDCRITFGYGGGFSSNKTLTIQMITVTILAIMLVHLLSVMILTKLKARLIVVGKIVLLVVMTILYFDMYASNALGQMISFAGKKIANKHNLVSRLNACAGNLLLALVCAVVMIQADQIAP